MGIHPVPLGFMAEQVPTVSLGTTGGSTILLIAMASGAGGGGMIEGCGALQCLGDLRMIAKPNRPSPRSIEYLRIGRVLYTLQCLASLLVSLDTGQRDLQRM